MTHLKLLKTQPAPPPDYVGIYNRALHKKLASAPDDFISNKDWVRQIVYLFVKGLPIIWGKKVHRGFGGGTIPSEEKLNNMLNFTSYADQFVSKLTPRELMQVFPITKEYDGHKYESKDYFSTIKAIKKIGMDTLIGDRVSELFWDYQNRHVREYLVFKMGVVSDLRRWEGKPGLMEEFFAEKGITPMRMMKDDNGKQFLYDPAKHTTIPVKKSRPRYLREV